MIINSLTQQTRPSLEKMLFFSHQSSYKCQAGSTAWKLTQNDLDTKSHFAFFFGHSFSLGAESLHLTFMMTFSYRNEWLLNWMMKCTFFQWWRMTYWLLALSKVRILIPDGPNRSLIPLHILWPGWSVTKKRQNKKLLDIIRKREPHVWMLCLLCLQPQYLHA